MNVENSAADYNDEEAIKHIIITLETATVQNSNHMPTLAFWLVLFGLLKLLEGDFYKGDDGCS